MKKSTLVFIIVAMLALAGCKAQASLPVGCPSPLGGAQTLLEESDVQHGLQEDLETVDGTVPVKTVVEGEIVSFPNLRATDPDGDPITYSFGYPLDSNGEWQTERGDADEYNSFIVASDGVNEVRQHVKIIVLAKNDAPIIEHPDSVTFKEGELVQLVPTASDPDGDEVQWSFSGWMTEASRQTSFDDSGDHVVTVTASDGKASSSKDVTISVENVNRAPELQQIKDIVMREGDKLIMEPVASDPDGDEITFAYSEPLDANGEWQTGAGDAGSYRLEVIASDGELQSSIKMFLVVEKVNHPPVISNFADLEVDEGDIIVLTPAIEEPDGDEYTAVYSGWMTSDSKQTGYDDAGTHTVTLTVSDFEHTIEKTITVKVNNVNRPPVFGEGSFS